MSNKLNSEQEVLVKKLIKLDANGEFPARFDERESEILSELDTLGYLKGLSRYIAGGGALIGITSKCRTYFEEVERDRQELKEARRHDYLVASYGFIGGAIAGAVTSWLLSIFEVIG